MAYTWLQFKNAVKSLMSDAALNNTTAVLAISEFVKAYIVLQIDRNPSLSQFHMANWAAQKDKLLGYTVTLSRDLLRAEVDKLLTVDSNRHGIQTFIDDLITTARNELAGSASFIDGYIRQGVIDIQHFIDFYKLGHERIFTFADAVENGEACDLTLPEGCMIQDVYYVSDAEDSTCKRMPVAQYDWQNRYDLTCGQPTMTGHEFFAAINPKGTMMTLFPTLLDGYHASVFYDGVRLTFADGDTTPFDEGMAMAIGDYVRARMYLQPPVSNPKMAGIHMEAFRSKRLQLYRDSRDKQRIRFTNDSDFPGKCGCAICTDTTDSSSGSSTGGCNPIVDVATAAEMVALASAPCRHIVFIRTPEAGVARAYTYVHGDTTEADGSSVIAPTDDLGRYFEFNL